MMATVREGGELAGAMQLPPSRAASTPAVLSLEAAAEAGSLPGASTEDNEGSPAGKAWQQASAPLHVHAEAQAAPAHQLPIKQEGDGDGSASWQAIRLMWAPLAALSISSTIALILFPLFTYVPNSGLLGASLLKVSPPGAASHLGSCQTL
jgi:hypothetical protein